MPTMKRDGSVLFACLSAGQDKDTIVAWMGNDVRGTWECSVDPKSATCLHIKAAKLSNLLHELMPTHEPFDEGDFASSAEEHSSEDDNGERAAEYAKRESLHHGRIACLLTSAECRRGAECSKQGQ